MSSASSSSAGAVSACSASRAEREGAIITHATTSMPEIEADLFFKLPAELRNRVYFLCLATDRVRITKSNSGRLTQWGRPLAPNLLLVNRQIYNEARAVLYAKRVYSFDDAVNIATFLEQIGTAKVHVQQLKCTYASPWSADIRLHVSENASDPTSLRLVAEIVKMKEDFIWQSPLMDIERFLQYFLFDVKDWLKTVIQHHGRDLAVSGAVKYWDHRDFTCDIEEIPTALLEKLFKKALATDE